MFSLFLIFIFTHISQSLYLSTVLFDYVSIFFFTLINPPWIYCLFVFCVFVVVVVFEKKNIFFFRRAVIGPRVLQQVT